MKNTTSADSERAGEMLADGLEFLVRWAWTLWPTLLVGGLMAWGWNLETWVDWVKCLAAGVFIYWLWPLQVRLVAQHRMTARVRRILAKTGLWGAGDEPRVRARRGRAAGTWSVVVQTPVGVTDDAVANLGPHLKAALSANLVEPVPVSAGQKGGKVSFDVVLRDLLFDAEIAEADLDGSSTGTLTEDRWTLPVGVTATGETRSVTLWDRAQGASRALVVGNSGTGKSSSTLRIVRSAIENDLDLYAYDPAGAGVRGWGQQATAAAYDVFGVPDFVDEIRGEFERRLALISAGRADDLRPCVILFEEFGSLLEAPEFARGGALVKEKPKLESLIKTLAFQARKTGMVLVISLQDSAGESLGGTQVRSQFNLIFAFPLDRAKAGLVLDDHGADLCEKSAGQTGLCVLSDVSNRAEARASHLVRLPAVVAPEKTAPPIPHATSAAATVVEEAEEIVEAARKEITEEK